MHLLVTRPEPDAADTARRLRTLGHRVTVEPLLRIVPSEPPDSLPEPAGLIVTSRNGVRALTTWPQAAGWNEVPLFAVGEATAEAARAAGFRRVTAGEGDGVALAGVVGGALPASRGPIVYAAAREMSSPLADELRQAGYDLRTVEAYRAERVERLSAGVKAALAVGTIDGALFYSRRTAETFRDLTTGLPLRLAHVFALSARVAGPLQGLGPAVHVAPQPNETSLIALIPPQ